MGKYCLFGLNNDKTQCSADADLKMDFFESVQNGKIKKVKKMLEIGTCIDTNIIVNYKDPADGSSPLHKASENGHLEIVKILIQNGAIVNATNKCEYTPLNIAAENGHLEVVKILLINGADTKIGNQFKWIPLHCAAIKGHINVVKYLAKSDDEDVQITKVHS